MFRAAEMHESPSERPLSSDTNQRCRPQAEVAYRRERTHLRDPEADINAPIQRRAA